MKRVAFGNILAIVLFVGIMALFIIGVNAIAQTGEQEQLEAVQSAILKAVIQCYALEGQYPPNLDYLTGNYGLSIDREKFIVYYVYIASNLMPEITVLPRDF
jgi:hypothetical protein